MSDYTAKDIENMSDVELFRLINTIELNLNALAVVFGRRRDVQSCMIWDKISAAQAKLLQTGIYKMEL